MKSQYTSEILWKYFNDFFERSLIKYNEKSPFLVPFTTAIHDNKPDWTKFFTEIFLQDIVNELNRDYPEFEHWFETEYLRIDAVIYARERGTSHYEIPIIFMEFENINDDNIEGEYKKLCSVNAPLKLLFTGNWEKTKKQLEGTDDIDGYWDCVPKDFCRVTKLVGYLGVIVFDEVKHGFYCFAIDENLKRIPEKPIDYTISLLKKTNT